MARQPINPDSGNYDHSTDSNTNYDTNHVVKLGSQNAGHGDSLRSALKNINTAFDKIDANFEELYSSLAAASTDLSAVTGDIIPAADNQYNLGSPIKQWKHVYVAGGSIYLDNIKLSNNNGILLVQQVNGAGTESETVISGTTGTVTTDRLTNGNNILELAIDGNLTLNGQPFIGSIGPQGIQGEAGPQGPQGIQGEIGPQGPQGIQGPKGDKGDTGAAGASVAFKGSVTDLTALDAIQNPEIGDSYIVEATGNLYAWNGADWTDVGQIVGMQGPQGDTGPQGPQGPQGPAGTAGAAGEAGTSFIWKGIWDAAYNSYAPNDVVEYNGSSYVAIQGNFNTPPNNIDYWQLMAQKGAVSPQDLEIDGGYASTVYTAELEIDGGGA